MQRTAFINYEVSGEKQNAYSVELNSEDNSFGIKRIDTGEIIVNSNTSVTNSSVGKYEYTFDVIPGVIYAVSWKILPSYDSQPRYVLQKIGPFSSSNEIRASTQFRGRVAQNSNINLFIKIVNMNGDAIDPEGISALITDESGTSIKEGLGEKILTGYYVFDWNIPSEQPLGKYYVTWNYKIDGISYVEIQELFVSTGNTNSIFYSSAIGDIRMALEYMIHCIQNIPVYNEQAIPIDNSFKFYKFTFSKWNQSAGVKIYRNNIIYNSGVEIDYFKGRIIFDEPLSQYDIINSDYNFRWFSDDQLDRYLVNAINVVNSHPPFSAYDFLNLPDYFIPAVLYGAAADALRTIMLCLQLQQPQLVFGGPDAAQKAFSNMETLKKNYENMYTRLLDQKKFGPYPKMRINVNSTLTLPGGVSRYFRYVFAGQ